jgi:multiple sugar transport system permease protein
MPTPKAPAGLKTATRAPTGRSRLPDHLYAYLFIVPVLLFILLLVVYPIYYSLNISLYDINVTFGSWKFIGLAQYVKALQDPAVHHALLITALYTVFVTVFSMSIAVGGALLLNEKFPGRGLLLGIVILPWSLSTYATAVIWRFLYSAEVGMFNALLRDLGLTHQAIDFLSARTALLAAAVAHSWQLAPLGMYFMLATLGVVPDDLYKLAKLDKLGAWGRFWHVTFPYLKLPFLIQMVLVTGEAARTFDLIFFMTGGGPGNATRGLSQEIYVETFQSLNLGYGAAESWILVLFILVITTAYFFLLFGRKRRDSEGQLEGGRA